jgi:hypothetical protein
MRKTLAVVWIPAVLAGVLLGGCAKDNGTGPGDQAPLGVTNEQSAMQYYAANDEFVKNDEITFVDQAIQPTDYGTFGKIDATVTPLRWGRSITNVTRNVSTTVQPGDSLAIALIEKTLIGELKIRAKTGAGDTVTITKPFTDKSTRYVIFKRVNRDRDRFWLNWVPVASSLIKGGTIEPNNLINITKLELFVPDGDTVTVTDPSTFFLRYRWLRLFTGGKKDAPELIPGTMVRLRATIVSSSPDTDVVALRYGFDMFHGRRMQMTLISQTDNGNGTYTREYEREWPVHFHRGFFNAGVDALTRGTLFDDEAPYSVSWWGIPYRVM